jgi:O6-methylguanine-DNA--protein-cysteine methyltransferase
MSNKSRACVAIEDLVAAATGEAAGKVAKQVGDHVRRCEPCRNDYARYRAVDAVVGELRAVPIRDDEGARERLLARLTDLRSRIVRYAEFTSPLGPILVAATETGIALVEYLGRRGARGSWLFRNAGLEPHAGNGELKRFHTELSDYLAGRRTHLDWPLDLRLATSDFHRAVLRATAKVPYGAVSSYVGIAHDIGRPDERTAARRRGRTHRAQACRRSRRSPRDVRLGSQRP